MIRRNFLTDADAAKRYIDGVRRLKDPAQFPWPEQDGLSIYDSFVFWHHQTMMLMTPPTQSDRNAAHSGPSFLPWHRYFLVTLEGFLRRAVNDDQFRIPYWDWSADAELDEPVTSPIWNNTNLGQFAGSGWRVRLEMNLRTGDLRRADRSLRRDLGSAGRLPGREAVRTVIRETDRLRLPAVQFILHPACGTLWKAGSGARASITMFTSGSAATCRYRRHRMTRYSSCTIAMWTASGQRGRKGTRMPPTCRTCPPRKRCNSIASMTRCTAYITTALRREPWSIIGDTTNTTPLPT